MSSKASDSPAANPNHRLRILLTAEARKDVTIAINDLLQVQFPDDPALLSLASRVDDIVGDRIHIAWPTDRGIRVPIHAQQLLTISFARDDAIYAFTGIVERMWREPLAQLSVLMVGPPQRIQRRQFFRVKSLLPVEFFGELPSTDKNDPAPKIIAFRTQTYEISGSGLAVRHPSNIPAGTLLECKLVIATENAKMKILCKIVHSTRISVTSESNLYHVGMYFLSIREADRTRIVRHVFGVERNQSVAAAEEKEAPDPSQVDALNEEGERNNSALTLVS